MKNPFAKKPVLIPPQDRVEDDWTEDAFKGGTQYHVGALALQIDE